MEDESNPWPSFVDTFSTVLCIFIFLMLVFALNNMIIMYDNSIKVYKANIENKTKSTAQNSGANDNSNDNEIVNKEVNTQDVSDGMTTMSGKEVGVYDIADGQKIDITSTKNELVITYHGRLRSFSEEDTHKIEAWLEDKINSNLLIEMVIPQADISFSDSLRLGYERGIILMKEIKKIYPDVVIDMSVNSAASSTTSKAIITTINKKGVRVKYINHYRYLFVCFFLAILPFFALSFPGIREYVFDNFMVSAIYNGVIIAIYITGSLCALFTILKNISAKDILIAQDASRKK